MANSRRRNGGRGRNRGSLYARPIVEPCNFLELRTEITITNGVGVLTHAQVAALLTSVIPVTNISKYRISSIVIDPVNSASSIVSVEAELGISGLNYQSSLAQKPLRIRLGKEYGTDGMWMVLDGADLTNDALPGNETTSDSFIAVGIDGATVPEVEVHLRFAWMDPS